QLIFKQVKITISLNSNKKLNFFKSNLSFLT
ncbi:MAG: hypothetical protein ACJAQ1_000669, partial [Flavobacterium sp.]